MKKVLFIINTMGRAGAEAALITLLEKLTEMGSFDISLFSLIPRGEMFARIPQSVCVINKHVSEGSVLSSSGRFAIAAVVIRAFFYKGTGFRLLPYFIKNVKAQRKSGRIQLDKLVWRLISDGTPAPAEEYDLGVAFIEGASTYYLADKVKSTRKASFVHIDYQRAGYLPIMDKGCYSQIDRIFAVSHEAKNKFCSVYPECAGKTFLFRNIIDAGAIRRKAEAGTGFSDSFNGIRLVTVGRLSYQKGYDIAVEALSQVVRDGFKVRWYIIGEGPERKTIERLIQQHGIADSFILLGEKENPYPCIKQCDIYVQATRFEGKSIAVEEAQILGKPILASDCTGNSEQIISGVDGVLFPLSSDKLAEMIKWMIQNPELCQQLSIEVKKKNLDFPEDICQLVELMQAENQEKHV